jgi:hypothetical protein
MSIEKQNLDFLHNVKEFYMINDEQYSVVMYFITAFINSLRYKEITDTDFSKVLRKNRKNFGLSTKFDNIARVSNVRIFTNTAENTYIVMNPTTLQEVVVRYYKPTL